MSDFDAFFASCEKPKDEKFVVSKRFKDKDGNPLEWELHPISAFVNNKLQADSTKRVGKRSEIDAQLYILKMVVATVKTPNLNKREYQEAFGAMGAEDLILKMLTAGEYSNLMTKVQEVNGFEVSMDELVEEAKN